MGLALEVVSCGVMFGWLSRSTIGVTQAGLLSPWPSLRALDLTG